ncbi:MAG TPA: hypothetical protein VMJ10_17975 [Kofleriaceae bacterium]|nr:hypothetical protein [Kofleriaceae bacterium]
MFPLVIASGCTLVPLFPPQRSAAPPPAPAATAEAQPGPAGAAPAARAAPAAPETAVMPACPRDLSQDRGKRSVDVIPADFVTPGVYAHRHFAAEHKKPPKRDFALAADAAVDRVIAIEQRAPGLVPAGFRAAVAAHPRDAALRAQMAECEAAADLTQRRAGYDAALAFLLGDRGALGTLANITRDMPVLVHGMAATPRQKAFYSISKDEAAIEDALTRGLFGADARLLDDWGSRWVHACGTATCLLQADPGDRFASSPKLMHWDLRDGGVDLGGGSSGPSEYEVAEKQCRAHTGEDTVESCQYMCGTRDSSEQANCNAKCAAWCPQRAIGE